MFAGIKGGNRHFGVKGIGCGDRDRIDFRIGKQIAPVACRAGETELGGFLRRKLGIDLCQCDQSWTLHIAENAGDVVPRQSVALAM